MYRCFQRNLKDAFAVISIFLSVTMPGMDAFAASGEAKASPDAIAWQQFVKAVGPSPVKGKVAYETWASDQDIYVAEGQTPTWPPANANLLWVKSLHPSLLGLSHLGMARDEQGKPTAEVIGPKQGCKTPPGIDPGHAAAKSSFPAKGCVGEEVRRDHASFDYLVQNGLWSLSGLQTFFKSEKTVAFPNNAVELKVDWIPVRTLAKWINQPDSVVIKSFYTSSAVVAEGGTPEVYAMTSIHLSIKTPDYPDWIWADFENAYTPGRCDQTGCIDGFGAAKPFVPAKSTPWQQYGVCRKTGNLGVMMNAGHIAQVFNNYCLTGSQVVFTAGTQNTLLGSPIVEPLNADVPLSKSSCISCHAGASFNASGPNKNVGEPIGPHAPPPGYKGYDFMWGVFFAQ